MTLLERLPKVSRQLRDTPHILELLMADLDEEDARWKPEPERFSVLEVLSHLRHVEQFGFVDRVQSIVKKEPLGPYDPEAFLRDPGFSADSLSGSLALFRRERAATLSLLETYPASAADARSLHATVGDVSVSDLLHEQAFHDVGHIRQIAELTRVRLYYARMGAYRKMYQVRP